MSFRRTRVNYRKIKFSTKRNVRAEKVAETICDREPAGTVGFRMCVYDPGLLRTKDERKVLKGSEAAGDGTIGFRVGNERNNCRYLKRTWRRPIIETAKNEFLWRGPNKKKFFFRRFRRAPAHS